MQITQGLHSHILMTEGLKDFLGSEILPKRYFGVIKEKTPGF